MNAITLELDDYVSRDEIISISESNPVLRRANVLWKYLKKVYVGDLEDFHQVAILAALEFTKAQQQDKYKLSEVLTAVTKAIRLECQELDRITEEALSEYDGTDIDTDNNNYISAVIKTPATTEAEKSVQDEFKRRLIFAIGNKNYKLLNRLYIAGEKFDDVAMELYGGYGLVHAKNMLKEKVSKAFSILRKHSSFDIELQEQLLANLNIKS